MSSIKRRITELEKARRETANQERKCAACGTSPPPFDQMAYETMPYDDAIAYIVNYYCAPCSECGQESEMGRTLERIYGDGDANNLAE